MTDFRRLVLKKVDVQSDTIYGTHAGLWLDKYLESDEESAKKNLVNEAVDISTPKIYCHFFECWRQILTQICGAANCREAKVLGRLAINLGSEAVLETSIALHHTYGTPYIPGSALKGLAAHYVLQYLKDTEWKKGDKSRAFETMFGDTSALGDNAAVGCVTFYDALYVPESGQGGKALWKDVITVHHQKYYQSEEPNNEHPPADWDSPVPIPFVTATGRFLIALSGKNQEWVRSAFEILELALAREGVGAKTSSGYGRMQFIDNDAGATTNKAVAPKSASLELPAGYERGIINALKESYGFIRPEKGGKNIFFHNNDLAEKCPLSVYQKVIFKRGQGNKPGNEQAFDVRIVQ